MNSREELEFYLQQVEPGFREIIRRIPPREEPLPTPYWLHLEMIERFHVLRAVGIKEGNTVLEIGCGAHALTTVPLAYLLGPQGNLFTTDRERWTFFHSVVHASGLQDRIFPFQCTALTLPLPSQSVDCSVLIHGVRSLGDQSTMIGVFAEMLRVSPTVCVAETLPCAHTSAQRAHLDMYNLREELFQALSGRKDDVHYLPLDTLCTLMEKAGGTILSAEHHEMRFPHFLAYFPKEEILRITSRKKRRELLKEWKFAHENLLQYGEEHPPVGIVTACAA
ncbi:MAG: class I SAM-dependent methyltransferase [Theionarchaea archaeon]|nr:class I SAM-dependent methyltransferase [Theionarchaea archaeon]